MKKMIGSKVALYPMPVVLVGANVGGRPNYITIAHVGIADLGTISLSMGKSHYTNAGIVENECFSVNLPGVDLVKETDYCGLVSGRKADKSKLFETFYGTLEKAPMIVGCPVNMECRLVGKVDMPSHDLFLGEVVETHVDESCTNGDKIDFSKVHPILFAMYDKSYFKLGERFADAWSVGKELMK
jgi:flavin reductase (DIM6/NTAB) family NADH-FMN oxidoreductase RutF